MQILANSPFPPAATALIALDSVRTVESSFPSLGPAVTASLDAHPIPYAIVIGNPDLVQPYKFANLPVTLLIDRRGRIADAADRVVEKDAWEQETGQLLRER